MKKLLATILTGLLIIPAGACFADTVYYVETTDYRPSLLDKIEDSTQDFAQDVGDATVDAAHKTGAFVKDKSKEAAQATDKAVRKEPLYGTVCYQSTKTRYVISSAYTSKKWSYYNNKTLLNDGWSYTGNKRVK